MDTFEIAVCELSATEVDQVSGGLVSPPPYPHHQGNTPQLPAPITTKLPPPYTS
jgi:hypothetical protein